MTPLAFLESAGAGAVFASRPGGVAHAYVGPLTPSGRFTPRSGRAVCKTRTRRLRVVLDPRHVTTAGLCVRCSAGLLLGKARLVEHRTREEWAAAYAGLTPFDLAYRAHTATTPVEADHLGHLALLLFAPDGHGLAELSTVPVVSVTGKPTPPLDTHLRQARVRTGATQPTEDQTLLHQVTREAIRAQKQADRHAVWAEKEHRREQVGFVNAELSRPA